MKPLGYMYDKPHEIVERRMKIDEEESRIKVVLSELKRRRKLLWDDCKHLSSMKRNGEVLFCQDCGFNKDEHETIHPSYGT